MFRTGLVLLVVVTLSSAPLAAQSRIIAPPGSEMGLPFSPGIASGDFLILSGALGNLPGTLEVPGDLSRQTRQTLDNLRAVLEAAGLDFSRVVDTNVYLADARFFDDFSAVYNEIMPQPRPARTTVEAEIALPAALTEVAMIAARPGVPVRAIQPEAWPPTAGAYSWGKLAGDTLFIAGMVSNDPITGQLVPGDVAAQTRQAMTNVGKVLAAADMSFDHVVSCRVFLPEARSYRAMNEVYPTFFTAAPPARATVAARLAHPLLAIEVQCTAVRGTDRQAVLPTGQKPRKILSPAIRVGDRLFLSGMVGRDDQGKFPPDLETQTHLVFDRIEETLGAAGLALGDVRDAYVYLADIRHYQQMNEVYRQRMGSELPARATVGARLMAPDALVEIQMTASGPARGAGNEPSAQD